MGRRRIVHWERWGRVALTMMTKMTSALRSQKRAMEEMSMELFGKNMGHQQEDREWTEVEEALRNWHNWGRPGTRYMSGPLYPNAPSALFCAFPRPASPTSSTYPVGCPSST